MTHAHPLEALLAHVHGDGEVPDTWVAEHAPTGSLERLWRHTDDAGVLIDLAALTCDRPSLVRAVCACAREVVDQLPPDLRPEARRALDLAARDDVDGHALASAAKATEHAYDPSPAPGPPIVSLAATAVHAAIATAAAAAGSATRWYDTDEVEAAANHAVASAAASLQWSERVSSGTEVPEVDGKTSPRIAAVLRATLKCPTLDDVRSGLRRMLERDAEEGD